jgi:hypothetical protein
MAWTVVCYCWSLCCSFLCDHHWIVDLFKMEKVQDSQAHGHHLVLFLTSLYTYYYLRHYSWLGSTLDCQIVFF